MAKRMLTPLQLAADPGLEEDEPLGLGQGTTAHSSVRRRDPKGC